MSSTEGGGREISMKIGIATFNNALSYGAMMQAFALKSFFEELGHEAYILNCECNGNRIEQKKIILNGNIIKKFLKILIYYFYEKRKLKEKENKFEEFRRNYLYSDDSNLKRLQNTDLIVCGSDQIWNIDITKEYYDLFFGINKLNIPAMAYAGSAGDISYVKDNENKFFQKIRCLDKISCREKELNDFLVQRGIKSIVVVDPTLLMDSFSFDKKLNVGKPIKQEKYVFLFRLGKDNLLYKTVKKFSRSLKCKYFEIQGSGIPHSFNKNRLGDASPIEFLNYIKYANCVVTDSFHGVALSIVYKKDFYVVLPKKRATRISGLLEQLDLTERIIESVEKIPERIVTIDYHKVEKKLLKLKRCSCEYLKESVKYYESL